MTTQGSVNERVEDAPAITVLPARPRPASTPQVRRATRQFTRADVMLTAGAGVSATCTTLLFFGRLAPLSGKFGFVVVAFFVFLGTYTVLLSMSEGRPAVVDRLMSVLLTGAGAVVLAALSSVIVYVFFRGWHAIFRTNTYVQDLSRTTPTDGLGKGGVAHAIVGTLIIMVLTLIFTVPLGLACAVYLNEGRGRVVTLVRTVVTAMTALPSILAGLFIFSTLILSLGFQKAGLAAAIAVSIMMLPIIIRAADVVLRLVPGNLREAAAALGAPQWRTVWHVVLPTARSGLTTSVILGVARGIGETAPVLLTAGFTKAMNYNPTNGPMVSLPLLAYDLVRSPLQNQVARGFATAAVLLVLVLVLFTTARVLGGRPAGRLSKRQAGRAMAKSHRDLQRINGRQQLNQSWEMST
jgi:phosphate transport system permease protein